MPEAKLDAASLLERLVRIESKLDTCLNELAERTERYEESNQLAYRRGWNAGRMARRNATGQREPRGPYINRKLPDLEAEHASA